MLPHLCPFSSIKLAVNSRQTCLHLGACATQAGELRSSQHPHLVLEVCRWEMKRDPGNEVGDMRHMHGPSCDALS